MSLELFSNRLKHYCRLTANSLKILAGELGLNPSQLSHKLNGTANRTLTHAEVKAIIKILANWEAISSQQEAMELLALVNCPSFTPQEWQKPPLNQLERLPPVQVAFTISPALSNTQKTLTEVSTTSPSNTRSIVHSPKNNLPGQLSSFIGREKEKMEVKGALFTSRLLTLTGTGGVGKTRLSFDQESFPVLMVVFHFRQKAGFTHFTAKIISKLVKTPASRLTSLPRIYFDAALAAHPTLEPLKWGQQPGKVTGLILDKFGVIFAS